MFWLPEFHPLSLTFRWHGGGGEGAGRGRGKSPDPWVPSVSTGLQGDIPGPCWDLWLQLVTSLAWLHQGAFVSPRGCPSPGLPLPKPPPLPLSESRLPTSAIHLQPCRTSPCSARGFPVSSQTSSTVRQAILENETYQLSVLPSCVPHTSAPQLGKPFPEEKNSDVFCATFPLSKPSPFYPEKIKHRGELPSARP